MIRRFHILALLAAILVPPGFAQEAQEEVFGADVVGSEAAGLLEGELEDSLGAGCVGELLA